MELRTVEIRRTIAQISKTLLLAMGFFYVVFIVAKMVNWYFNTSLTSMITFKMGVFIYEVWFEVHVTYIIIMPLLLASSKFERKSSYWYAWLAFLVLLFIGTILLDEYVFPY